jgi:tetratricopeptide (TPR) repeat protein
LFILAEPCPPTVWYTQKGTGGPGNHHALREVRSIDSHTLLVDRFASSAPGAGEAYRSVEEGLRVAREGNLSALLGVNEFFRAARMVQLGEINRGLEEILRDAPEITTFAQTPVGTLIYPALAEAYLAVGRNNEGIQAVSRGIAILEQNQARMAEPELHRLNGEPMLLAGKASGEPENSFRRAIEIAREQDAKWYELRATNALARLLMRQNRRDEAHAMLADIYNWFTEGFDTADVKDAKALLDELSNQGQSEGGR